jgi:hypothetical protein
MIQPNDSTTAVMGLQVGWRDIVGWRDMSGQMVRTGNAAGEVRQGEHRCSGPRSAMTIVCISNTRVCPRCPSGCATTTVCPGESSDSRRLTRRAGRRCGRNSKHEVSLAMIPAIQVITRREQELGDSGGERDAPNNAYPHGNDSSRQPLLQLQDLPRRPGNAVVNHPGRSSLKYPIRIPICRAASAVHRDGYPSKETSTTRRTVDASTSKNSAGSKRNMRATIFDGKTSMRVFRSRTLAL